MKIYNDTFNNNGPFWANACVGNNGHPGIHTYAHGYASAANLLLEKVIENEGGDFYVDTYVYPICFNMRHSVELYLKSAALKIISLYEKRKLDIPPFDLKGSHDIGNIWEYIKNYAIKFDKRLEKNINKLDQYIIDIAEIDATGQVFRYPFDTENIKHLVDVNLINLISLKKRWNELKIILDELEFTLSHLVKEYSWNQFTKKLSRAQLGMIAATLPPLLDWKKDSFNEIKEQIRKNYNLSKNDLSKAIEKIKSNIELTALFDESEPIGIESKDILHFLDCWHENFEVHPIQINSKNESILLNAKSPDIEEIKYRAIKFNELARRICLQLDVKSFAKIEALYYFWMDYSKSSKNFDAYLNDCLESSINNTKNREIYLNQVNYLIRKSLLFENILNSLNFLGQKRLVQEVIMHFNIEKYRDEILLSSKRELLNIIN